MNTENIISEFKPIDYFIEKNKITLLFSENDKFMYSFFIDKNLITSDIVDENEFIVNFKKYLDL